MGDQQKVHHWPSQISVQRSGHGGPVSFQMSGMAKESGLFIIVALYSVIVGLGKDH